MRLPLPAGEFHTVVLRRVVHRDGELLRLIAERLEDDMANDAVAGDGDETVTPIVVSRRKLDSLPVTDPGTRKGSGERGC